MKRLLSLLLIILILPLVFQSTPTEILKLKIFDALVTEQEPSGNFVILNITEEDVEREGGWPFPRQRLAQIQVDLINEGAIGIGWVISFPQADRMGGDEVFAEALGYSPSVIAMFEDGKGNFPSSPGTVVMGDDNSRSTCSCNTTNTVFHQNHSGILTSQISCQIAMVIRSF